MSAQRYVFESIQRWVWAGYYSPDDVQEMISDILEDDCDETALRDAVIPEFARKHEAETLWPAITECERLDTLFFRLHERGICALGNAGYTMSDGHSDIAEVVAEAPAGHYHGYCFYHGQDIERAMQGHGLMLAFGDLADRKNAGVIVGRTITNLLAASGFRFDWDGTIETRISLPHFDWKRRGPPDFNG